MITFLFAGHETTSGLLSFTFYYLLSNPAAYARAQQEVDHVLGDVAITAAHLGKLPYLSAVLRESLRLSPTVPAIALAAKEDTTLGGKYQIKANAPIIALFAAVHRDPRVYGSDANAFRPERMLDEHFHRRNVEFPNCWKPFGNGMRGCIGRSFAWQQALLVAAMLLQSFDVSMSDPSYRLKIKQSLTIKPDGFRMRARPRRRAALPVCQRLTVVTGTTCPPTAAPAIGLVGWLVGIHFTSSDGD
jgi:cytochrome P450/NADPH-cytochrome P450 reductase